MRLQLQPVLLLLFDLADSHLRFGFLIQHLELFICQTLQTVRMQLLLRFRVVRAISTAHTPLFASC